MSFNPNTVIVYSTYGRFNHTVVETLRFGLADLGFTLLRPADFGEVLDLWMEFRDFPYKSYLLGCIFSITGFDSSGIPRPYSGERLSRSFKEVDPRIPTIGISGVPTTKPFESFDQVFYPNTIHQVYLGVQALFLHRHSDYAVRG